MVVSAGAKACLPDASGRVTINSLNSTESMHVEVSGLPANAEFDVFVIQVPNAPFGLAWYQGDIDTDAHGNGVSDFAGRFSIETFIVAPGSAPAPVVFTAPPFPDTSANLGKEGPVQLYHLGIWFDSPAEAAKAGCANTETPFNGTTTPVSKCSIPAISPTRMGRCGISTLEVAVALRRFCGALSNERTPGWAQINILYRLCSTIGQSMSAQG
jgi:hypothetical protein